ncbi:MAG: ribosomal-protein-alanine N-acetyltransferase, partial [Bryobacteraceae bacterium]
MPRQITIRLFRKSDLPRILQIEKLCFASESWDESLLLGYFQKCPDLFLIVKYGRRIAGYSITCASKERAELVSIAVDPEFRTLGV